MIVYMVLDNRYLAEEAYLQSLFSMTDRQQQQAYGPLIIISIIHEQDTLPKIQFHFPTQTHISPSSPAQSLNPFQFLNTYASQVTTTSPGKLTSTNNKQNPQW